MDSVEASQAFLGDAAKHFVCLSYDVSLWASKDAKRNFASCFIVKIEGHWLLITAGHVINGIRDAIAQGAIFSNFNLHDRLAGNNYPFSVPIPFHVDDWVVVEGGQTDADYAASLMSPLIAQNLHAGGVRPIEEGLWGTAPFEQYPHWILIGSRGESYEIIASRPTLKLTLISLAPALPPESIISPSSANKIFAQIQTHPEFDSVYVTDVRGMSGGPIFGLRECNGVMKYWIIGIQSSWYKDSRTVWFCAIQPFFSAIKKTIILQRADESISND